MFDSSLSVATKPTPRQSQYAEPIASTLRQVGMEGLDVRYVEAWMRIENPSLDHLYGSDFTDAVIVGAKCVKGADVESSRLLAESFGLV